MANAFKNVTVRADATYNSNAGLAADTDAAIGSAVANATTTQTIIGMTVANITSGVINVSVSLNNTSDGQTWIVKDSPVPSGGSLVTCGGDQKICLFHNGTNGDLIKVQSNTANSMHIIMSYLEST